MPTDPITECHECGLLQRIPPSPPGGGVRCGRCGCVLHRSRPDSLDRTLALTLAGIVLFIVANAFPFLSLDMPAGATETSLASGVQVLYQEGEWPLSGVVLFTSILAPGLQLLLLLTVLLPLRLGRPPLRFGRLFRHVKTLTPWAMMDVFLLGILVSTVKLADIAGVVPGLSLFAFVLLIFVLAAAQASLDPDIVWSRIPLADRFRRLPAADESVLSCHACALTLPARAAPRHGSHSRCPRCDEVLHRRRPRSLQRTWALLLAAAVCLVPANLLPIMTVVSLGKVQSDTILSGVIYLFGHGMWPLALIVFVASVFVPTMKLVVLSGLAVSVQRRSGWRPRERTRFYRIIEAVGRWSMVDIYVVAILVTMVRLGNLASIEVGPGAVFFAAAVVLTIFAATAFDPRLIWDSLEQADDRSRARRAGAGG
jgi:paraquat-inducible protein A